MVDGGRRSLRADQGQSQDGGSQQTIADRDNNSGGKIKVTHLLTTYRGNLREVTGARGVCGSAHLLLSYYISPPVNMWRINVVETSEGLPPVVTTPVTDLITV